MSKRHLDAVVVLLHCILFYDIQHLIELLVGDGLGK